MSEREIVDSFLRNKSFQKMVEKELGTPIKVKVNWETRKVLIQSPMSGRELDIEDILKAHRKTLIQ